VKEYGGGIANQQYSSSTLTDVIISGNYASSLGGGIYNVDHSFSELENVLISGNYAEVHGGGIYNNESSYSNLTNVTISGNYAEFDGGGICNHEASSSSTVINTIVWGNDAGHSDKNGPNVYKEKEGEGYPDNSTYDHSLVEGVDLTGKGDGNFNGEDPANDPQFVSPVAPSPTPTTGGDYHLYKGSPLIGGGDGGVSLGMYEEYVAYYGIDLSPTTPQDFGQVGYNYDENEKKPRTATVKNTGSQPTGPLKVSLSGANAAGFAITANAAAGGISDNGGTKTFNVAPVTGLNVGTHNATVTVTVAGDESKSQSFDVSFKVNKVTPKETDLVFDLSDAVYSGEPQPVAVAFKTGLTGFGTITVKYNGSTDLPTAAGEYDVTVNIAGGDNYNAASLSLGKYKIKKAVPTVDDLDFDLSAIVYNGVQMPVGVVAGEGIAGLGEITVMYNGYTYIPDLPGTYAITVDIAAGTNYAGIEGLSLGTFIVYESPQPGPTLRRVSLPSVAGLTASLPAGLHYVRSGTDFTFTLTPTSPDGTPPSVKTSRTDTPEGDSLRVTPNGDGSYTVVIYAIYQNIEVTFSTGTDSEGSTGREAVASALTVYAVPGAITVENARSEAVILRVYTLAGALVHRVTAAPGATRLTVAPGVYIVVTGDGLARWKLVING
ncbi:MAG: MBG domain-containing protein, partial [Tannerella sp.]|nr:MBG domain-containing protein [Tannerella sp.]